MIEGNNPIARELHTSKNLMATLATDIAGTLLSRFRAVREATMRFVAPLSSEDLMVQSCPEASPVKWHLAHTTWFFETFVLAEFAPVYRPFHPDFRWLFNSYYTALGDMPEKKLRSSFSRPPLDQVLAYRAHVDATMAELLQSSAEIKKEALRRIALGLEHECQHLELIATDIKHALFTNPLHPAYADPGASSSHIAAPPLKWIGFSPGLTQIGVTPAPASLDSFAFDNETPRHSVYIAPFRLATRLVTCAEYLAFLEDNGYTRPDLWLSEGWERMRSAGWQAPLYWQRDTAANSGWRVYTLRGWRPLDGLASSPVCHLSFFEADAFARWSGHRLPTEFEWEHAATIRTAESKDLCLNLLESGNLHPIPAAATPEIEQLIGDAWEWTQSPYTGYPGYRPLPGALGEYNGKFMSSQMVLRGGSCVTPVAHVRITYRNFFHPATRWQFSGLRLAQDGAA